MKNPIKYGISLLFIAMLGLTACGSGGGNTPPAPSGDDGGEDPAPLTIGSFTKTVTLDTSSVYPLPFRDQDYHTQVLYLASDINGSGYINAIELRYGITTLATTCPDVTIKMGHTGSSSLTDTFADNVDQGAGSALTVRSGEFTIPTGPETDYFTVTLDQPFLYNGKDNLVIDFQVTACDKIVSLAVDNSFADRLLWTGGLVSPTGALQAMTLHTRFHFAGGENSVLYKASIGSGIPFTAIATFQHVQQLHLSRDIEGSGPITGIAMLTSENPTDVASYTVNIKLGHTTLSSLTDTFADNFNSGAAVTVASNMSFTVPAGLPAGTPIWIPLTGTFDYNGTDNLLVDIEVLTADETTFWQYKNTGVLDKRRLYAAVGETIGNVDSGRYETRFRFKGGTLDMLTDGGVVSFTPFNDTNNGKRQYLLTTTELGTGGIINKIACRLDNGTSVATDYPNIEIIMGHTSLSALNTTFADNMDDATIVFNSSFSLPAGLHAGDWIEIPLSTSFEYAAGKNLVISLAGDSGANRHPCRLNGIDSVRYPMRSVSTTNRLNPDGNVQDTMADLRLWFAE